MYNDEFEFLSGTALSQRIREICGARKVDCAVAFWGVGIAKTLFLSDASVRILCDLSQGATCGDALRELGAPGNLNLRVGDSFHGKLYLSERGAVVGSPNASNNGVGLVPGVAGRLVETAVYCPPGSSAYRQAADWFEKNFGPAPTINQRLLESAPDRNGELQPRGLRDVLNRLPLLDRLREYPQNFSGIQIAVATRDLDPAKVERSIQQREAARGPMGNGAEQVILQADVGGEIDSFSGPVLLFWGEDKLEKAYGYIHCSTWPSDKADTVFGTEDWRGLWHGLGQTAPARKLRAEERLLLNQLLDEADGLWIFDAEDFANRLRAVGA